MSQSNQVGDTDEGASIQPQNEATHASSRAASSSFNSRAKRKLRDMVRHVESLHQICQ